jgi:hypothetical protein
MQGIWRLSSGCTSRTPLWPRSKRKLTGIDPIRQTYETLLADKALIELETLAAVESPEGIALLQGRWAIFGIEAAPMRGCQAATQRLRGGRPMGVGCS